MRHFLKFLIVPLLFSLFFTELFAASQLSTTGELNYNLNENSLNTSITVNLKNKQTSPAVLNYYEIVLPHQSISDLSVQAGNKDLSFNTKKEKSGLKITINTKSKVIPPRSTYTINIEFSCKSDFKIENSYGKLITKIPGLSLDSVKIVLPKSFSEVKSVEGATFQQEAQKILLSNITQDQVSMMFRNPMVFKYTVNKTVINDSETENLYYEIPIPITNYSQKFILENIDPIPVSAKIDTDNNIILKFLIEPEKQRIIRISGFIVKENSIKEYFHDYSTETVGYWNLTNQYELNRLQKVSDVESINKYVLERLEIDKGSFTSNNSFENILRGGADIALGRKTNAVVEDYNDLLISILRNASIPSRLVLGYIPESSSIANSGFFHSWVEYFDSETEKWRSLDPSLQDQIKVNNLELGTQNYISLVIRDKNPLLPKLPYLNKNDISILPTNIMKDEIFDIKNTNSVYTNEGNTPLIYLNNGVEKVILPGDTVTTDTGTSTFSTLTGQVKSFSNEENQSLTQPQIFTYSLIFFISVLTVITINYLYTLLRKIWKRIIH